MQVIVAAVEVVLFLTLTFVNLAYMCARVHPCVHIRERRYRSFSNLFREFVLEHFHVWKVHYLTYILSSCNFITFLLDIPLHQVDHILFQHERYQFFETDVQFDERLLLLRRHLSSLITVFTDLFADY